MRLDLPAKIGVIDPLDRDIERILHECGLRAGPLAGAELAALAHPAAHPPDLVIVDVRGGRPIPAEVPALKRQHREVEVLVVGSTTDPKMLLDAMRAGAREYLSEPLSPRQVVETVTRMLSRHVTLPAGQVLGFVGAKGGVGTTTVAVNVATTLCGVSPGKVLVVDLHIGNGDAAILLGAEPRFSIVDALENTHRFDATFFRGLITPTKAGPHLLAASDQVLGRAESQQYRMVIDFAARLYQYVVLDVPNADSTALDALDSAAVAVIVANQELSAVRGASRLGAALRQRYGQDRVRVIVNRFDRRADITPADVERVVGGRIRHVVPNDYRLALQAMNRGRPVALDNHNKIAASYRDLAHDLAGVEPAIPVRNGPHSIFGRLTTRRS
jgi:pilus assembly protein CpaE